MSCRFLSVVCIPIIIALLGLGGCRHIARRPESWVSVLVSGQVEPELLPRAAALAAAEPGPMVWVIAGPVGADRLTGCLTEGRGILRVLAASGADAAVFGPEWLGFGTGRVNRLVSGADLQLLSANIADSSGEPLGHPMLRKRLEGMTVGLAAVWTDTTDPRLRAAEVQFLAPDRAADRVLGQLRMHCELVGLIIRPDIAGPDKPQRHEADGVLTTDKHGYGRDMARTGRGQGTEPQRHGDTKRAELAGGYDFAVGPERGPGISVRVPDDPGRMFRLDLQLVGGRIADYRVGEKRLADWPEQPELKRVVDSVQAAVDSMLSVTVASNLARTGPEELGRSLQDAYLARGFDGFLTDRPLFDRELGPGAVELRAVWEAMPEPGRPGVAELTGWMLAELTGQDGASLRLSPALRGRQLEMPRRYRVLALPGFFGRHPKAALDGYDIDDEPAWAVAARMLAGER